MKIAFGYVSLEIGKGNEAFENGKHQDALGFYRKVLKMIADERSAYQLDPDGYLQKPDYIEKYYWMQSGAMHRKVAMCLREMNRLPEALESMDTAIHFLNQHNPVDSHGLKMFQEDRDEISRRI